MITRIIHKFKNYCREIFDDFIFEHFLIAICAAGMVLTTYILNDIPVSLNPLTLFMMFSTFLVYNFHSISFKIDFTSWKSFLDSFAKIKLTTSLKIFLPIALLGTIINFLFLSEMIRIMIAIMAVIALAYSIPVLNWNTKKRRLRDVKVIKTPVVAIVWGVTTTILPVVEQNISLTDSFIWLQVLSRTLFIFGLCIPFEIRDMEIDKKIGVNTLAVIYGARKTKIIGAIIIMVEILTHFFMPLSSMNLFILNISSLVALVWIFNQKILDNKYFYKGLVDGTMLLRFLLLLFATGLS